MQTFLPPNESFTDLKRTHSIEDGFVLSQGDHAKPVAQVLQQGSIREISSCLVRGQKNLNKETELHT